MFENFIHWLKSNINLEAYPPIQLLFLGFGFIFWVLAYKEILQGVRKYKLVEIPMIVVAFDIAWEFNWAFLLENDLSPFFSYGCAIWFFMDIFINYYTLRYGRKMTTKPWLKKYYYYVYVFFLASGFFIVYFMRELAEDNGLGVISAYLINICISGMYIYQLLNFPHLRGQGISYRVAWNKFLGTGFISVVCFMHWPHNGFLLTMCVMVFVMDIVYIALYKNYQPAPTPELATQTVKA